MGFSVKDGEEGFLYDFVRFGVGDVELKISKDILFVKAAGRARLI